MQWWLKRRSVAAASHTHVQLRGGTPRKLFVFEAEVTLAADI
jgi:hypothetical protein